MASINAVLTAENGDDLYPETYEDYVLDSNGEAISTILGSRSEASGVSGTTAFGKINSLNSQLTVQTLTFSDYVTFDTTKATALSSNFLFRIGNLVILGIEFRALAESTSLDVGTISLRPKTGIYFALYDWTSNKSRGFGITGNPTPQTLRLYNSELNHSYSGYIIYPV